MSEQDNRPSARAEEPRGEERTPAERSDRDGARDDRRRGRGRRHAGGQGGARQGGQQQNAPQKRQETSFNMEELRELTDLFTAHGLTEFEFENAEIRVRLSRNTGQTTAPANAAPQAHAPAQQQHAAPPVTTAPPPAPEPAAPAEPAAEELHIIISPIVGTFYRAPSPNADSFVKAGSHVEPDSVVCIIEAMKLMNEIQAETTGIIEKIYVENGQPVEYGQPLFGVKK